MWNYQLLKYRYPPYLKCWEYNLKEIWRILIRLFRNALMITWPAYCWQKQPSYQSSHLQNLILKYWSYGKTCTEFYCFQWYQKMQCKKKMMKFGWLGAEIWKFYSRRYFQQDITSWDLGVLFQKVLPAGHNATLYRWPTHRIFLGSIFSSHSRLWSLSAISMIS